MDRDLRERLLEAGVDPQRVTDGRDAWLRLHGRFGPLATLSDRYALEAECRGVAPQDLPEGDRRRIAREVQEARYPGMELVGSVGADTIYVASYDPAWPEHFADWQQRIFFAVSTAVRIDHVGSTAVPGLAAKPIVDVQVSVPDVADEAPYLQELGSLGLYLRIREPGHRYLRPPPGEPRAVHVHVCEAGSRWEREHLLFRDYLRAESAVRDAYTALKLDLAARYRHDRLAYSEAKTGFILDALDHAQVWAERTGWSLAYQ